MLDEIGTFTVLSRISFQALVLSHDHSNALLYKNCESAPTRCFTMLLLCRHMTHKLTFHVSHLKPVIIFAVASPS